MATYTVTRETPDAFELGTRIKQCRRALETAAEDITEEIWNIRGKIEAEEMQAINESIEVLHLIVRSLEDIEAGADALEGEETLERHFNCIREILEKKPENRSKTEKASLVEKGIEEDGRTVAEIMADYRARVEAQE